MPSKDTPQENTDDMSIDELSAAIDAHMTEIDKPKPKKKPAVKAAPKKEPTPAAKKEEDPKEEPKEETKEDEGQTKIKVKHAYVSKTGEKSSAALPEEEKSQITHTSNVKLKPISESDKEEPEPPTASKPKANTVDVIVKTPASTQEPEVEPKEEPKEKAKDTPEPPKTTQEPKDEAEEVTEEKQEPAEEPVKTVEKPVIKTETLAPTPPAQRGNSSDELSAQIPVAKPSEESTGAPEGEKLKTFDTKQYHIPIKASHHHRTGGSFKVFIAVMVAILATILVLSELEIIDLASLVAN